MAQQNQPRILGSAPQPFDGKGEKAIAFWNSLANYIAVNETTFDTDAKKVPSALTFFKTDTRAGEWASDHIAAALACTPVNYGTWTDFKDAFTAQFIPPQTQIEVLEKMYSTPQGNREFNEWFQEWSQYQRRANAGPTTEIFAFRRALNGALSNKLLSLSPQPDTLATLVEKARDFDRSWRVYNRPTTTPRQGRNTRNIREISGEEPDINATRGQQRPAPKRRGKLTPQERKYRMDNKLCLYCGNPGHMALNCTALPNK